MRQRIIEAVDGAIADLEELFSKEPTRFFTENDLVCTFHRLLYTALTGLGLETASDKDNLPHSIIHCEYPTFFRCDMGGSRFEVKEDDEPTPGSRGYKRGHYDVAVLNPAFIRRHSYDEVKAQCYKTLNSKVLPGLIGEEPAIIYGVEFIFRRDEIKPSKGIDWEAAAKRFVAEVLQDTAKLKANVTRQGFMERVATLAFAFGTGDRVMGSIRTQLQQEPCVRLVAVG